MIKNTPFARTLPSIDMKIEKKMICKKDDAGLKGMLVFKKKSKEQEDENSNKLLNAL